MSIVRTATIQTRIEVDSILKEDWFPCIEDHKFTADEFINEHIHVDCYDRYNSDSNRS